MPWRKWFEGAKTPDDIVTARDVGSTWAALVKMVTDIRNLLRPIRWTIFVLLILVIATQASAVSARNAANRARDASNRAAIASDKATAQAKATQDALDKAVAAVTASQTNQGTSNARQQINDIYDACVVRKEC